MKKLLLTGLTGFVFSTGSLLADWVVIDDFNDPDGTAPDTSLWTYPSEDVSTKANALRLRGSFTGNDEFLATSNNLITLPTQPYETLTVEFAIRAYDQSDPALLGGPITTIWRGLGDSKDYSKTKTWLGGAQHGTDDQGDYKPKTYDTDEISDPDITIYTDQGFDTATNDGFDIVQDIYGIDADGTRWTAQRIFKYGDQWYDSVERYEADWRQWDGSAVDPELSKYLQFFGINSAGTGSDIYIDYIRYELTIPEPTTIGLMGVGVAALFCRRKRKVNQSVC